MKIWTNLDKNFIWFTYTDDNGIECQDKICRQLWDYLTKPLDKEK